jgi:hypothetical protein
MPGTGGALRLPRPEHEVRARPRQESVREVVATGIEVVAPSGEPEKGGPSLCAESG